MEPTPLKRLVALARKDKRFFKLLQDDRRAALRQAAEQGIKLSPGETKTLVSLLSGRRITLTLRPGDLLKALRAGKFYKSIHFDFWDIFCELIGYRRTAKSVSKPPHSVGVSESRQAVARASKSRHAVARASKGRVSARSRRR